MNDAERALLAAWQFDAERFEEDDMAELIDALIEEIIQLRDYIRERNERDE